MNRICITCKSLYNDDIICMICNKNFESIFINGCSNCNQTKICDCCEKYMINKEIDNIKELVAYNYLNFNKNNWTLNKFDTNEQENPKVKQKWIPFTKTQMH